MRYIFLLPIGLILVLLFFFNQKITIQEKHLDCTAQNVDVDWKGKKSFGDDDIEDEAFYRVFGMLSDKNQKRSLHLYKKLNMKYKANIESAQFNKCEYKSEITLLSCKEYGNSSIFYLRYDFTSNMMETSVHLPDDEGIFVEYSCEQINHE